MPPGSLHLACLEAFFHGLEVALVGLQSGFQLTTHLLDLRILLEPGQKVQGGLGVALPGKLVDLLEALQAVLGCLATPLQGRFQLLPEHLPGAVQGRTLLGQSDPLQGQLQRPFLLPELLGLLNQTLGRLVQ
jgi:hypothetical protein